MQVPKKSSHAPVERFSGGCQAVQVGTERGRVVRDMIVPEESNACDIWGWALAFDSIDTSMIITDFRYDIVLILMVPICFDLIDIAKTLNSQWKNIHLIWLLWRPHVYLEDVTRVVTVILKLIILGLLLGEDDAWILA